MDTGNGQQYHATANEQTIRRRLWVLIGLSVFIRGLLAWIFELGNDEVYYWTYAAFPDLSHFDHPPMTGWLIQLTTLNLLLEHEFFIRLGPVLLGGLNTWLFFLIGKKIKNARAGFIAAVLYNTSVYTFVIAGLFILPDTPQLFFWLASLWLMIHFLPDRLTSPRNRRLMLLFGIVAGLAMLSKYSSVFLWVAAAYFVLFHNRSWLKTPEFYLAGLLSALLFAPVLWWNYQHQFISFTFHGDRVNMFESGVRPDLFFTELFGQILYNNPVNWVLIIIALIGLFKKQFVLEKSYRQILLASSLPLIGMFLFFSLFRQTLPHWSGPGYLGLMLIAAVHLDGRLSRKNRRSLFPRPVIGAAIILVIALFAGLLEVRWGLLGKSEAEDPRRLGRHDVTLDMSGWRDFGKMYSQLRDRDLASGNMPTSAPIIATRWFPAAHLDFYVARPNGQHVVAIGELHHLHKYAWINRQRPPLTIGADAYYITSSRDFRDPNPAVTQYFSIAEEPEIVAVFKGSRHVQNFFVYRLRNLHTLPPDVLGDVGL